MIRIPRTAGHALALVFLSLSAFTAAHAQTTPYKYGYCYGSAGNPRGVTFTRTFFMGPSNDRGALGAAFYNHLSKIYGGYTTDQNDCPVFATAAEAEAARRKLWDEIASAPANGKVVEIDWIPPGASLASGAAPTPAAAAPAAVAANAQTGRYNYGYCYGIGGPPRVEVISRAFALGTAGASGVDLGNAVYKRYGPLRENGCSMYPTAAEAEAKHRELIDQIVGNLGSEAVAVVNWIPKGATALSAPVTETEPAAPKPPAPAPVAATAAAPDTAVKYDMWGKPIPTTAWWVCETHFKYDFYVTPPFFGATNNQVDNDLYQSFMDHLIKQFHEAGTATCNKFTSQAEGEQSNAKQAAQAASSGYQYHPYDWAYAPGAPAATAAPAPAKPATPVANAAVTPKPAPVAVAAKPASTAPAKPVTVAAKPAVYVICKADWNPDMRRFYNPPVDGRGAGYPEWTDSWHKYLVARYKFRESNFGCTKYPTREEAQAGFEEWVVNARQTPMFNGLPSPVIITNWKY